ncbi:MAG: T9SS type A sorting domain-containing protein, partial [Bacteroidetes bacterium]|nr:T9SS type A sorting domain-containing protein [Bacteroidota bacterium]
TTYDGNDFQYGYIYGASNASTANMYGTATRTGISWAIPSGGGGYILETRIPWTTVNTGGSAVAAGKTIGFDIYINDDDDGGSRDNQGGWYSTSTTLHTNINPAGLAKLQSCATTFYSKTGADLNTASNWNTATDASGTNAGASDLTNTSNIFIVQASHTTVTMSASTAIAGTLTVNGTLTPVAAAIVSGGTLNGSGTVKVTRTAATADFSTQYTATTKTLTSLTVDYSNSTGGQTVSAVAYGSLKTSNTSGTQTLAGNATVSGTLTVAAGGTLALSTYTLGSPTSTVIYIGSAATTISGTGVFTLGGNLTVTDDGGNSNGATISCPVALGASRTITVDNDAVTTDLSITGIISGVGFGITKAGAGTMAISGVNTFSGTTTTSAGVLQLGAAGVIADGSNFSASGGTFSTGSAAGNSETMGTLTLTANTIIALGTGSHSVSFAASNGTTWTAATLLRITGWTGSYNGTTGTAGKVYSGSSAELSAGKLAQIFFTEPTSGTPRTATQLSDGEIVPTATLPVDLIYFSGEKVKNTNELVWITATEINSDYFEVLRSADGINFESIGKVNAAGNSVDFLQYVFVDYAPLSGVNYYKLTQYDFDGANETFNVIAIENSLVDFKWNAIFPNPTSSAATMSFQSEGMGMYFLTIVDAQGKQVYAAMVAGIEGENQFNFSTSNFSNGNYFVTIVSPKNKSITNKMLVQN